MQQKNLYIAGMHCKSCETLLEKSLINLDRVDEVEADSIRGTLRLGYTNKFHLPDVQKVITACGYAITEKFTERPFVNTNAKDWLLALGSLIIFFLLYNITGHFGFHGFDLQAQGSLSLGVIVLLGLTAGFSTCMALIGGLIMGVTAQRNKKNDHLTWGQKMIPHLRFHVGRVGGFMVLGGILGLLGSFFKMSPTINALLTVIVAIILLILGLNLTGLFPRLQKLSIKLPSLQERGKGGGFYAILAGVGTFFLPCGFTLAAQVFALGTGSVWIAASAMGLFAIGTLPGLVGIGALTSFFKGTTGRYIYQIMGVLLVLFALWNVSNARRILGPIMQTTTVQPVTVVSQPVGPVEQLSMVYDGRLTPATLAVQKGKSYKLTIDVQKDGRGCMFAMTLPGLDDSVYDVKAGTPIVFTFTPTQAGTYELVCSAMGMRFGGAIVVSE